MSKWSIIRKKPYTAIGVRRLRCIRCSAPAVFQWTICSDGNNYRPLCMSCDVALNKLVLEWMGHPRVEALMTDYSARVSG